MTTVTMTPTELRELADRLSPLQYATGISFTYKEFRMVIDTLRAAATPSAQGASLVPAASPGNGAEKYCERREKCQEGLGICHCEDDAALHTTSAAGETTSSDGGALSSLPSGENEPVVTQAYPSSEAANVLAMKEAWRKFSMLMIVDGDPPSIVYPTDIDANAWASAYDDLRAAIDKLSPEVKAEGGRYPVPEGQTPLNDNLCHKYLDVFREGATSRDTGAGSPYHGHSLEHCLHAAGWVQRDLRLALDKANAAQSRPASPPDVEAIRADERERCATEVERRNWPTVGDARRIASAIRTGGQK